MSIVGEKYSSGEFFLPQMMIAARAMQEAVAELKPLLTAGACETKATVVLGADGYAADAGQAIDLAKGFMAAKDSGARVQP